MMVLKVYELWMTCSLSHKVTANFSQLYLVAELEVQMVVSAQKSIRNPNVENIHKSLSFIKTLLCDYAFINVNINKYE